MKAPQDGEEMIKMTDAEKLALIGRIVDIQASEQNDEDGDKFRSDAYLAMEAIDAVLNEWPGNGALRTFTEAMQ